MKAAVLLLPASAPALAITLPEPAPAERAALVAKSTAASSKSKPAVKRVAIGFGRAVPPSEGVQRLSGLQWTTLDDGERVAQIRVTSSGASALRVQLALAHAPAGLSLRFASASSGQVYGPYSGSIASQRPYWSPILEGDTATVEIALPPGIAAGDATVTLPMISHLVVAPAAFKQADPLHAIGTAGACEVDVACMSATIQQQAANAIGAVVRVALTDAGTTILCSATLVNDSIASGTPYLYFASHCIDSGDADPGASRGGPAAAAASINTYWFFQAM
ncbi:MAG TPA: hypothetical protein VK433_00895, partial [Stellaceae bacterium]|nr:hypothetical protein [Stellaceae bacterium]